MNEEPQIVQRCNERFLFCALFQNPLLDFYNRKTPKL